MPHYTYRCPSCSAEFSAVVPVALRRTVACAKCNVAGDIIIKTAPLMSVDLPPWEGFESPATGRPITSRRQLEEDLRASGCHIRETGEEKDTARRRAEIAAQREAQIDKMVVDAAQGLGL